MRRPHIRVFIEAVKKYPKNIGLKVLYRDYQPDTDEEKDRFRLTWDVIAKELKNDGAGMQQETHADSIEEAEGQVRIGVETPEEGPQTQNEGNNNGGIEEPPEGIEGQKSAGKE